MEEGAKASAQEENICWTPKPDQVSSEVESNLKTAVDQGEILKELEEKDVEEEIPEADQAEFLKLFAQLQKLNPGFHDKLPTSEDDLLAASDSEESHGLGDGDRRPLLEHAEDLQGPPDKGAPSLLHVATGQGLRAAAQHLLRSVQGQRSGELLSSEANQEDFLSLLHYEGGISVEEDDRIALAHSDVMIGAGCQKMEVEGRAVAPEKVPPEPACDDLEERRRKVRRPSPRLLKESTGLEAAASSDPNLEASSWKGSPDPSWLAVGEPALNRMEDSSPTSDPVVSTLHGNVHTLLSKSPRGLDGFIDLAPCGLLQTMICGLAPWANAAVACLTKLGWLLCGYEIVVNQNVVSLVLS